MTDPHPEVPEPGPDASVEDIHADIEATRNELGHTVEALTAKLDVKAHAKQRVDDTKELLVDTTHTVRSKSSQLASQMIDVATDDEGSVRPAVPVAAVAVVAVIAGVLVWRRRR